jgi:hypothetical protein
MLKERTPKPSKETFLFAQKSFYTTMFSKAFQDPRFGAGTELLHFLCEPYPPT